ncbi:protein YhfH [Alicyclobacillus sp. ALC3]|uniref:protein YhfH n=1 Tax=Alicyclobacillus sp. ALC3 TaxID=2796143 RepID=UPI0023789AD0|nr:protein YhfH [Alicyclobacillus sp. ALC3]WDL97147.1 YhfH family protein [Alicyclobacillus sp. ALC3]
MNTASAYESTTEFSGQFADGRKECMVCGSEIDEQFESILFECERCMNERPE